MPELPEVETVARYLRETVVGKRVVGVESPDERFAGLEERHELVGRRIERVDRRGKYLSLVLDDGWVLQIHLMMAGRLLVRAPRSRLFALLITTSDMCRMRPTRMSGFSGRGLPSNGQTFMPVISLGHGRSRRLSASIRWWQKCCGQSPSR